MNRKLILLLLLFAPLLSCKKNRTDIGIQGTWYSDYASADNYIIRNELYFSDSSHVESSLIVFSSNKILLGYRGYANGTYSLLGNKLTMSFPKSYTTNTLYKANKEDLVEVNISSTGKYNYSIDQQNREMVLTSICPPNADCTGPQTYKYK